MTERINFLDFDRLSDMISNLSISLLWRLENTLLHKSFLAKCLFTEVLPLPLLPLTLEKEKVNLSNYFLAQPTSFSISAHFAFFFSFLAFRYSFREAASSFLFFVEFWGNQH